MKTIEIAKLIKKKDLSNDEAYELAETINGRSGFATKEDIGLLKKDINKIESRMGNLETSNKWIVAVLLLILSLLVKIAFF